MEVIKSSQNSLVKQIRKLNDVKNIKKENKFILDNIKTIDEAYNQGLEFRGVAVKSSFEKNPKLMQLVKKLNTTYDIKYIDDNIFESLLDEKTPQGIVAIVDIDDLNHLKNDIKQDELIVMLDNLQDPGNLGTIIRTMDSCNLKTLILSNNSCNQYNPKVVRASMGSILRVNILNCNLEDKIEELKKQGYEIISTTPNTKDIMYSIDFNKKACLIIGNEANGISEKILELSDKKVKIPMIGKAQSLNAGVATSVILYEYVRQKVANG